MCKYITAYNTISLTNYAYLRLFANLHKAFNLLVFTFVNALLTLYKVFFNDFAVSPIFVNIFRAFFFIVNLSRNNLFLLSKVLKKSKCQQLICIISLDFVPLALSRYSFILNSSLRSYCLSVCLYISLSKSISISILL